MIIFNKINQSLKHLSVKKPEGGGLDGEYACAHDMGFL
jgi:hypothetical protein